MNERDVARVIVAIEGFEIQYGSDVVEEATKRMTIGAPTPEPPIARAGSNVEISLIGMIKLIRGITSSPSPDIDGAIRHNIGIRESKNLVERFQSGGALTDLIDGINRERWRAR